MHMHDGGSISPCRLMLHARACKYVSGRYNDLCSVQSSSNLAKRSPPTRHCPVTPSHPHIPPTSNLPARILHLHLFLLRLGSLQSRFRPIAFRRTAKESSHGDPDTQAAHRGRLGRGGVIGRQGEFTRFGLSYVSQCIWALGIAKGTWTPGKPMCRPHSHCTQATWLHLHGAPWVQ